MADAVPTTKFTAFELIAYLVPGLLVLLFFVFTLSFTPRLDSPILIVTLIIGGLVTGNLLHEISNWPEKLVWWIYDWLKERDSKGHGVAEPKHFKGKIAKLLRYNLLELKQSDSLKKQANGFIEKEFRLDGKNSLDLFYPKELLFNLNSAAGGSFSYLHYQTIFCKSMAMVFFIIAVWVTIICLLSDFAIHYGGKNVFDREWLGLGTVILSIFLNILFTRRFKFFENFRKQIVNAYIIYLYSHKPHE